MSDDSLIVTDKPKTRCGVFVPIIELKSGDFSSDDEKVRQFLRTPQAQLEEACGLAEAIELEIVAQDISRVNQLKPATLYGGGKVDELLNLIKNEKIDLVLVDHPLTPVQQRNLERAWDVKVLDRTGVILEIFGARAQTREGKLQVDLAALRYQKGRLVRSWTHLERQRGGGGFLGGPGETQIESDRRELQNKIERLEKQLEQVKRTRALHRKKRQKNEVPIIAFVGYTNAGKSTLFNSLTQADVFEKDLLFATLDPTLRRLELPQGTSVVLTDTVGFISNLPTDLIAAFRATLEEVVEADIIVHVRDISHEDNRSQAEDVLDVLSSLGVDVRDSESLKQSGVHYLEVWNKVDNLDDVGAIEAKAQAREGEATICLTSAHTGEGIEGLLSKLEDLLNEKKITKTITLYGSDLLNIYKFYNLGSVLSRFDDEDGVTTLTVRSSRWHELNKYFSH